MTFTRWSNLLSLGWPELDEQHKAFVGLLNRAALALGSDPAAPAPHDVLDELMQHAAVHFATEESLMQQYDFPERARHEAEHRDLWQQLQGLRAEYQGSPMLALELLGLLEDWLVRHIAGTDRLLGEFLVSRGAASAPSA